MIFKPTAPNKILTQQRGPISGLMDERFRYVPADKTDIRATFARIREQQLKAK